MNRVLICSHPYDIHGAVVQCALRQLGHEPICWFPGDFPESSRICLEAHSRSPRLRFDTHALLPVSGADALWLRRWRATAHRRGDVSTEQRIRSTHAQQCTEGALRAISEAAHSVNGFDQALRAECKIDQLRAAGACGLRVPRTLVSNDPPAVRAFVRELDGHAVAKPLRAEWLDNADGTIQALHVEAAGPGLLGSDADIAAMPYIYQQRVDAMFEIRVTVIGEQLFACRVDRHPHSPACVDQHLASVAVAAHLLEPQLARRCRDLLDAMDLRFGCIDLLMARDGTPWFLEVNQAGQFLWVEHAVPQHRCLAALCALLVGCRAADAPALATVLQSAPFAAELRRRLARPAATSGFLPRAVESALVLGEDALP